jgi:MoxR-like ATPase
MNNVRQSVVYITVGQIRKAIKLCILAQQYLPLAKRFGAIVWGESGIGKNGVTDGIHEDLSKNGKKWLSLDCNVSAMDPTDIDGIPAIVNEKIQYYNRYNMPSDSFGIFRLDEIDRPVYIANIVSVIKYAVDRTTTPHLPLNWFVLGLGNGIGDTLTQQFSEHMKGRFVHLYVSANSSKAREEMSEYWNTVDAEDSIKKMARLNPMVTKDEYEEHAVYNNRSLSYANAILKAARYLSENNIADVSDVLLPVLAGAIGKNNALELLKIHELQDLPSLQDVIANPQDTIIPDDLSLRHKFVTTLVHEAQSDCTIAIKLLNYLVRLPNEVARYAIETLSIACPDICKSKIYVQWVNRIN